MIWNMTTVWLVLIIVFALLEILTVRLLGMGMLLGAIGGLVTSITGLALWIQIPVFLLVSLAFLLIIRPIALIFFSREKSMNIGEKHIGRSVIVVSEIDNAHSVGRVTVDGKNWMARSVKDGEIIGTGSVVRIIDSDGSKLIVKKIM